jgi:hypothetical protein
MMDATNQMSWLHHLTLDLLPYVCIFENCDTADFLYKTKDEWWSHLQTVQ